MQQIYFIVCYIIVNENHFTANRSAQRRRSGYGSLRRALCSVFDLDEADLRVVLAHAEILEPGFYSYVTSMSQWVWNTAPLNTSQQILSFFVTFYVLVILWGGWGLSKLTVLWNLTILNLLIHKFLLFREMFSVELLLSSTIAVKVIVQLTFIFHY